MKTKLFTWALLFCLCVPLLAQAYDWKQSGERLHYDIRFWGLKAGEAELLFKSNESVEDEYSIIGRAWSTSVGSLVNIRDRISIEGVGANTGDLSPRSYTARLNENDYRAHKRVDYKRDEGKVSYRNIHANHDPLEFDILEGSKDMVSALYTLRHKVGEIKVGDVHQVPVFDLNTQYVLNLKILSREKIKGKMGKRYAYHVVPVLEGVKDRNKKDRWHFWISDDEMRLPLKIKVKLKFGSFEANLLHANAESGHSYAPKNLPQKGEFTLEKKSKTLDLWSTD